MKPRRVVAFVAFWPLVFFSGAGIVAMWRSVGVLAAWPLSLGLVAAVAVGIFDETRNDDTTPTIMESLLRSLCTGAVILSLLLIAVGLFRWEIVGATGGGAPFVYRLDRLTGRVELSIAGGPWIETESDRPDAKSGSGVK